MKLDEKIITLKNGQSCLLRSASEEDSQSFIHYLKQIYSETEFMTRYEDEFEISVEDEKDFIAATIKNPHALLLAAFLDGRLVASANLSGVSTFVKSRHRAGLGISVAKEFWNSGFGSVLLSELIDAAKTMGFEQLELEVVAENERAIALYKKFGFVTYGTREGAFKFRDGTYHAEHLMMKTL